MRPVLGRTFEIYLAKGAKESWKQAKAAVPGSKNGCIAQLTHRIKVFSDFGKEGLQRPQQLRSEGDGFYAIKATCGLRAYFWYQALNDKKTIVVISHFILKKRDKLASSDKDKMINSRNNYKHTGAK